MSAESEVDRDFEDRIRDSGRLAFHIAYGVLRQRQDAEEIAQEAFARAFHRLHQLRDRERFRAWLTRTTWRLAIDRWRADRRREARELQNVDAWRPSVEQVAVERERARHVWLAIDRLPEKLRIVTVLAAIEGHDTREVALLLDIPEGTVKSRLFSARRQLAERLRWLANDTSTR
ncbi:MAG: RNA polymerase sigma factor [Vicinamibacterales bacterium]